MLTKKCYLSGYFILMALPLFAQKDFNDYKHVYPISEDSDMHWKSSYAKSETILFEANPFVRFSFHNNIRKRLMNDKPTGFATYAAFKPQLRMYVDNSLPVKTPSYKIELGHQRVWRHRKKNLFAVAIESGHYSNGQAGAAFSEEFKDASAESDSIYRTITDDTDLSAILNRSSGNFSTNLTEVIVNYRFNKLEDLTTPKRVHSIKLGFIYYHDRFWGFLPFGGYSDEDIELYGRWRLLFSYEFVYTFENSHRIAVADHIEIISGAHPSVEPLRNVLVLFSISKSQGLRILHQLYSRARQLQFQICRFRAAGLSRDIMDVFCSYEDQHGRRVIGTTGQNFSSRTFATFLSPA
jgi:hypothetical protein